jgi:hypothetical protein
MLSATVVTPCRGPEWDTAVRSDGRWHGGEVADGQHTAADDKIKLRWMVRLPPDTRVRSPMAVPIAHRVPVSSTVAASAGEFACQ